MMKPIFLDSATIFTSEMVLLYFLRQNIVAILQSFLHKVIILEYPIFTVFPPVMSQTELSQTLIFKDEKSKEK